MQWVVLQHGPCSRAWAAAWGHFQLPRATSPAGVGGQAGSLAGILPPVTHPFTPAKAGIVKHLSRWSGPQLRSAHKGENKTLFYDINVARDCKRLPDCVKSSERRLCRWENEPGFCPMSCWVKGGGLTGAETFPKAGGRDGECFSLKSGMVLLLLQHTLAHIHNFKHILNPYWLAKLPNPRFSDPF